MKKIFSGILVFTILLFAVPSLTGNFNTTISGKVIPVDGVEKVWAISDTDSVNTVPNLGTFVLSVKPATYKIVVDAKAPYQDLVIEDIKVEEGKNTDVGELRLIQ